MIFNTEYDIPLDTMNKYADFWHYKRKINIFPLENGKATYENWSKYQGEAIPDEIHEEWKRKGRYAKGIILMPGKIWKGEYKGLYLIGIDFDKDLGIKEFCNLIGVNTSIDELKQKFIVEQHSKDPYSLHVYFYSEIPFTDKSSDNILGIEIKSNNKGLMCATPSYHSETDSRWQIKGTDCPIILKSEEALRLMLKLDESCNKYGILYLDKKEDSTSNYLTPQIREMIEFVGIKSNIIIQQGERHNTLLSIANSLLFKYWRNESNPEKKIKKEDELLHFMYRLNNELCKPEPISENELKSIWISAKDYVNRKISENDGNTSNNDNNTTSKTKNSLLKNKEFKEKITEPLIQKYHFLTIEESKNILFYENGVYKKGGEIIIEKELESICGYSLKSAYIDDIKGHIRRRTYIKSEEFDKDLNIINLRNGLYNIQANVIEPHTPQYPSLNQKPIAYDVNAKPILFGQFLKQVLYPKDIRTAIEMLSYTFLRTNPYELIFILVGIGANGKNVFTGTLTHLHGLENVSNLSLKSMLENRFALAGLENNDVNIDTELQQGVLKDISIIKKLTGKQRIAVEKKGIDIYNASLHAKFIFCTNTIPSISDNSDARFRRQVIIVFPYQFEEGKNADPKLLEKLTSEEEKSGIFNILMKALRRIQKNDKIFLDEKTIQERRQKHELISNPIKSFINDAIAQDSVYNDDYTTKENLYKAYRNFCTYHKLPIESQENFSKILKREHRFEDGRKIISKERKTIWIGIKLVKWNNTDTKQQILIPNPYEDVTIINEDEERINNNENDNN